MHSDPTRNLIDALTAQRVVVRRLVPLGAFLGSCAAWRLLPVAAPEPFVGVVLPVGGLAMAFAAALAWAKHEDARSWTDDLIVSGYVPRGRRSPIERAVARRREWVARPRARRPSLGYMRASGFPALARSERRVLLEELPLVNRLADRIEADRADPTALVLLRSVISSPPSQDASAGSEAGEELRRRLRAASRMIGQPSRAR